MVVCLIKSFVALLILELSWPCAEGLFLSNFLKKSWTYADLAVEEFEETSSILLVEAAEVVEDVALDAVLIYFLKYSESSSTTISYFKFFLWVGAGITSEYDLLTSILTTESLYYPYTLLN